MRAVSELTTRVDKLEGYVLDPTTGLGPRLARIETKIGLAAFFATTTFVAFVSFAVAVAEGWLRLR